MRRNNSVRDRRSNKSQDGFINVAVSKITREGLNNLKDVMGLHSQAEVIEKLVAIGVAIQQASR
jgi:hypothetical protein